MSDRSKTPRGTDTRAVHGADHARSGPVSTPIVHSSTFAFDSLDAMMLEQNKRGTGAFYQRYGHPTVRACEERIALLEESEDALLFPSGMAAISSVFLARLRTGDHVVSLRQCYGGTTALLRWGSERLGWTHELVDAREPGTWEEAFTPHTSIFHIETPANPLLNIVDIAHAAKLAHKHQAWLTVDNTVASPIGQHPLELGADVAMYSATKSLGGHSDLLAGVVTGPRALLREVDTVRRVFGPFPEPSMAWQLERSLKTLPLRVRCANDNALELAVKLEAHPGVQQVFYPGLIHHPGHEMARRQMRFGFGPLLSFDVKGGAPVALAVYNALRLVKLAASLGGVESLASLPSHTSHIHLGPEGRAAAGISEGLVRLSVGIEDEADLWADLEQALHKAAAVRV